MGTTGASAIQYTTAQQRIINNMHKLVNNRNNLSDLIINKNSDNSVSYEYKEVRKFSVEKGGKMSSPDKADIVERTTIFSGNIMPDGLRKQNKSIKSEKLIKKGKLGR